ncbi:RICIN domain-containing protein [Granulicella sibirica]|nr:hypothetical protein [Granulicella sibirica]
MNFALMIVLALQMVAGGSPSAANSSVVQPQGSHGVRNEQYGLMLRPRDASNKDGEPIVLYPYETWKCMAWKFESAQDGVRLVNYFTSKSFEVQAVGGTSVVAQKPATPEAREKETMHFVAVEAGLYKIEVQGGAGVLTAVDSDGRGDIRVVVQPWKQTAAQKWQLVDLPDHFTA